MRRPLALLLVLAAGLAGCDDMTNQPKEKHYTRRDGSPATPPAGIVAVVEAPVAAPPVTLSLLTRGRERYDIYCSACHGATGTGNGMIVQRGFPMPPSFDLDRLRQASPQHLYDVVTGGHGVMYGFAGRIGPPDRWAIAAYVKALQASRNAAMADVPPDARGALE
ncbi:MAG TPA: cytochrome c [Aliidongia sp.]|uniref:c-type cytochrome n=1 Tax=Aliidongia sp. TaxID=1914230 RepID=UPI002DDC9EA0|nr:cytochrome c [Aliidongia sp.]HEV2673248.1 cytochrome c [Aliidongia sp.]